MLSRSLSTLRGVMPYCRKFSHASLALVLLFVSSTANSQESRNVPSDDSQTPNIIIIYADDLGYGDVSCYNEERGLIPTPNIDRLASEGIRFTDAHSSSGVCSPSRYTLLTGRYHWRTRLQRGIVGLWGEPLIDEDRLTIAQLLKQHGYTTHCIGKWHLGWEWAIKDGSRPLFRGDRNQENALTTEHVNAWRETFSSPIGAGPTTRGFDFYFGTDVPNWPPFCFIDQDRTVGIPSEFLPAEQFENNQASVQGPALEGWTLEPILPAIAQRTVEVIESADEQTSPFFVYMPLTSPHTPLSVNEEWLGSSGLNLYADFVIETDAVVGQVLDAIDQAGIGDSTLVLFTSDNGCAPYIGVSDLEEKGHYPSGPLRGYKSDVWEGGHRVPFIARWPSVIAADQQSDQLIHQADIFSTIANIVGVDYTDDQAEDSFSFLPILQGNHVQIREHAVSQSSQGLPCIRRGQWKLIFGKGSGGWGEGDDEYPAQLYHLGEDIGESNNLFSDHPEIVAELTELMEKVVEDGRSTNGPALQNDRPFNWRRFMSN